MPPDGPDDRHHRARILGKAKIGKLNVDENGQTAMRYNVRGIPTLLLFKGGKVVEQRVGAVGKSEVQKMLDATCKASAAPGKTVRRRFTSFLERRDALAFLQSRSSVESLNSADN